MKWWSLFTLAVSLNAFAIPYRIVIMSDPGAMKRATEFKALLLKTPPFSKLSVFDLEVHIMTERTKDMDCKNNVKDNPRIINCNKSFIENKKASVHAHLMTVFTSVASGGSGGSSPIASTDYDLSTMLHEMLHSYGLDDEYNYSGSEAKIYCSPPPNMENSAYFNPMSSYPSDSRAREFHAKDVAWMDMIPKKQLITQGSWLGSKESAAPIGSQRIGLYRSDNCANMPAPKIQSWRPYPNSIMRSSEDPTIYPLYERAIRKSIEAKLGRRLDRPLEPYCPPPGPPFGVEEELKDLRKIPKRMF